jgi:hypothetical protein
MVVRVLDRSELGPVSDELGRLSDHVVILNANAKVAGVLRQLHYGFARDAPEVVVMVQEPGLWQRHGTAVFEHDELRSHSRVCVVEGCPAEPEDLDAVRIDRARAAVILADERQGQMADAHSTLVAVAIERRNPQVHTVIELISSVHRVHLRATEVNEVVCLGEMSEKLIAQSCITPGVRNVLESLVATRASTAKVFAPPLPAACNTMTYVEVAQLVIRRYGCVVCGFGSQRAIALAPGHHPQQGPMTWVVNPRPGAEPGRDTVLHEGDALLVIAYQEPDLVRLTAAGSSCDTDGSPSRAHR